MGTPGNEVAASSPRTVGWVVKLRPRDSVEVNIGSAGNEHPAIGQQRGLMNKTFGRNAARALPGPGCRIINFATGYLVNGISNETGGNEHLAVGQQGRGMVGACLREAPYFRPCFARWIVHFRAR